MKTQKRQTSKEGNKFVLSLAFWPQLLQDTAFRMPYNPVSASSARPWIEKPPMSSPSGAHAFRNQNLESSCTNDHMDIFRNSALFITQKLNNCTLSCISKEAQPTRAISFPETCALKWSWHLTYPAFDTCYPTEQSSLVILNFFFLDSNTSLDKIVTSPYVPSPTSVRLHSENQFSPLFLTSLRFSGFLSI